MSGIIITANYRDRYSPYKWLIREADKPIETARACKRIEAEGVEFQPSDVEEARQGCTAIACVKAGQVQGFDFEDELKPINVDSSYVNLQFDGGSFRCNGRRVNNCQRLVLQDTGSMMAVLGEDSLK